MFDNPSKIKEQYDVEGLIGLAPSIREEAERVANDLLSVCASAETQAHQNFQRGQFAALEAVLNLIETLTLTKPK